MAEPDFETMRVLVADDEPRVRALVAECARSLGSQVIEASDGGEAWELAQSRQPDLVVLDVMMPAMSGWEVCRRIKTAGKTRRGTPPKVIVLTGIGEHLNEMTSPLFAADDWIDKPFALAELSDKLIRLGRQSLLEPPAASPSGPDLKKARLGSDPPAEPCCGARADGSERAAAPGSRPQHAGGPPVPRATRKRRKPGKAKARGKVNPSKRQEKPAKAKARAKVKAPRARHKRSNKGARADAKRRGATKPARRR
jgi:CheY-like chemotaxis protein